MALKTLEDLFINELRDLLSAEKQLVIALPKMAKAATSKKLQAGFQKHLTQTEGHVERLETILEQLGKSARGPKCEAMEGLVKEGKKMIEEEAEDTVKDAGLIAAAQRVEHYEIAGYGTARAFANLLGHAEAEELLRQTLDEEKDTNEHLSVLAMSEINVEAMHPVG